MLEVNQNRIQAGRTSIVPFSQLQQESQQEWYEGRAWRIGPAFYNKDRVRSQEGNCDVALAEAAKCQARDDGSMAESVGGPGKRR